ncbi:BMP family ABC transporter substrate-binding protein [Ruminococcaceae bacterium OttesenSCG-928-A11]|nr:BMP family ABC transporter substrate-binding protein [Ruminococcaceae bacterium OttesenSCG-928-A11]
MKKFLALALVLMMMLALAACGGSPASTPAANSTPASTADAGSDDGSEPASATGGIAPADLKIGAIHDQDEADQGFTFNQVAGIRYMLAQLGLDESQYIPKFNVSDQDEAQIMAAFEELIASECQIIFACGFGYGTQAEAFAEKYPEVKICQATGSGAHYAGLSNFHNYFAKIHQARYLAGVVAGMKAKEIGNPKLGYIGAFPFAEVISGYTAFYLGAKSVYEDVVMDVVYINAWGDAIREAEVAQSLIDRGCGVISQHSDNVAPSTVAESNGAFHVGYNNDMISAAPGASLISARVNWGIYYTIAVQCLIDGTEIPVDWGGGIVEGATDAGAAYLSPLNEAIAAEGTKEALDSAIAWILEGDRIFSGALKDNNGDPLELYDYSGNKFFTFEDESSVYLESDVVSAPGFAPKEGTTLAGITIVE